MPHVKKPGYMKRAIIAWCIFNSILILTLALIVWILGPWTNQWFVMIPLLIAIVVSEWIIMAETIAPIIKEWIKQEEYVPDPPRSER